MVQVEGVDGAAPAAKKARYSLLLDNDVSAAPAAAGPAAPAAAAAGVEDAAE